MGAEGGLTAQLIGFAPIIGIFILFYFLLIRPQQKRAKEHATAIAAVKRVQAPSSNLSAVSSQLS